MNNTADTNLKPENCKQCKKRIRKSLDCVKCSARFHPSCAVLAKVIDDDENVLCCNSVSTDSTSSSSIFSFTGRKKRNFTEFCDGELNSEDIVKMFETIMKKNDALENQIAQLIKDNQLLHNDVKFLMSVHNSGPVPAVLSKPKSFSAAVSSHSVAIKPKDLSQVVNITKSELFQSIDPLKTKLPITNIRNISNGGVLVSCSSAEGKQQFEKLANETMAAKYDVKGVSALNPRIRIVGIKEQLNPDTFIEYLKVENSDIFKDVSSCKLISLKPLRKDKNSFQAVVQVSDRSIYDQALTAGKLVIGYVNCPVYDAVDLRRCFKCCGFHHFAKDCKSKPVCPRCVQVSI